MPLEYLAVQKSRWCRCTVPLILASGARTPTIFGTCDHISAVHVEFMSFVNHPLVAHARVCKGRVGVCPLPLHTHNLQMRPFLIPIRVTLPAWLTCGHTAVQPETLSLLAWALSLACGSSTSGLSVLQGATVPLAIQKSRWCRCTCHSVKFAESAPHHLRTLASPSVSHCPPQYARLCLSLCLPLCFTSLLLPVRAIHLSCSVFSCRCSFCVALLSFCL